MLKFCDAAVLIVDHDVNLCGEIHKKLRLDIETDRRKLGVIFQKRLDGFFHIVCAQGGGGRSGIRKESAVFKITKGNMPLSCKTKYEESAGQRRKYASTARKNLGRV